MSGSSREAWGVRRRAARSENRSRPAHLWGRRSRAARWSGSTHGACGRRRRSLQRRASLGCDGGRERAIIRLSRRPQTSISAKKSFVSMLRCLSLGNVASPDPLVNAAQPLRLLQNVGKRVGAVSLGVVMKAYIKTRRLLSLGMLAILGLVLLLVVFHNHPERTPTDRCAVCQHVLEHPATTPESVSWFIPTVGVELLSSWFIFTGQSAPTPSPLGRSPPFSLLIG